MSIYEKILILLMVPTLFGGWIWVFLISFRELLLSIMFRELTTLVLTVPIFELWKNRQVTEVGEFGFLALAVLIILSLGFQKFSQRYGISERPKYDATRLPQVPETADHQLEIPPVGYFVLSAKVDSNPTKPWSSAEGSAFDFSSSTSPVFLNSLAFSSSACNTTGNRVTPEKIS